MNTLLYANEIKERERENSLSLKRRHHRERMNGDVSPFMISDKLTLPSQLQCLSRNELPMREYCSGRWQHFLATWQPWFIQSLPGKASYLPKDSRGDRTFMLSPSRRIPGIKGLIIESYCSFLKLFLPCRATKV